VFRAVLRLIALLTFAGLATSRIGLIVHELVGHGAATLAVGGTVTDVQLFYLHAIGGTHGEGEVSRRRQRAGRVPHRPAQLEFFPARVHAGSAGRDG
jgi:hypothetical protein